MLLERNGKLTMWKSKSSRLLYSLVESLPPLFMMNVRSRYIQMNRITCSMTISLVEIVSLINAMFLAKDPDSLLALRLHKRQDITEIFIHDQLSSSALCIPFH